MHKNALDENSTQWTGTFDRTPHMMEPLSLLSSFSMVFNWISPGLHRNFIKSIEQFPHQSVKIDVYLIRLIVMVKCILCTEKVENSLT